MLALDDAGYARYDERTARMLGENAALMLDLYGGDLRRLRAQAQFDPQKERWLLMQFKGIGNVGANIFCREVQLVWNEHYPFADGRALHAAQALGLGSTAEDLAQWTGRKQFVRLITALVRVSLSNELSGNWNVRSANAD